MIIDQKSLMSRVVPTFRTVTYRTASLNCGKNPQYHHSQTCRTIITISIALVTGNIKNFLPLEIKTFCPFFEKNVNNFLPSKMKTFFTVSGHPIALSTCFTVSKYRALLLTVSKYRTTVSE
jgi:hypothetical protein